MTRYEYRVRRHSTGDWRVERAWLGTGSWVALCACTSEGDADEIRAALVAAQEAA